MDYYNKEGRGGTISPPNPTLSSEELRTLSSSASSSRDIVLAHREVSKHNTIRFRKKKPKTRTGCVTCKYRRVKCDEGKPHCQRCLKFGVDCEGYASDVKPPVRVLKTRVLLPRGAPRRIPQLFEVPPISKIHGSRRFADEIENQCFRVYLDQTARQIQGPFHSSLWERLIPQMSEMEPFVRHAIIAIGALSKQKKSRLQYKLSYPTNPALDYEYALKQYGKSLRGMRDAIASGQHDIRKALIACILVFCFEGLLGNQASAAAHAESGLNLLHHWTESNKSSNRFLEKSLIDAFTALDLQLLFFMDNRSPTVHHDTKASLSQAIESMPQEFESLDDARFFWQLIIRRNYHFNKAIQGIELKSIQEDREDTPWEGSANMPPGELLLSPAKDEPLSLKEEQLRYRKDIDRWSAASATLFKRVGRGQNEAEMVGAAILQTQAKTNHIMLAATFFATEMAYDIFIPEFAAIVVLSEYVYPRIVSRSDESAAPRFHHDIAIVPPLYLAATKCRVDAIRQKAIALLFSANYREGIWDAPAVGHMAVWLRSVEREGLDNDQLVPEENRAFLTAINCDLHNNRAILSCGQRTKDGLVSRNTLLTW